MCKAFNLEPGSKFDLQEICNGMRKKFKEVGYQISNKGMQFFYLELEKMINLPNYTDEQLKEDY